MSWLSNGSMKLLYGHCFVYCLCLFILAIHRPENRFIIESICKGKLHEWQKTALLNNLLKIIVISRSSSKTWILSLMFMWHGCYGNTSINSFICNYIVLNIYLVGKGSFKRIKKCQMKTCQVQEHFLTIKWLYYHQNSRCHGNRREDSFHMELILPFNSYDFNSVVLWVFHNRKCIRFTCMPLPW